jgi:hypothetical protein
LKYLRWKSVVKRYFAKPPYHKPEEWPTPAAMAVTGATDKDMERKGALTKFRLLTPGEALMSSGPR